MIIWWLYQKKKNNHDWHNCHFDVPYFFHFFSKVQVLILLFIFCQFYSVDIQDSKVHHFAISFFFLFLIIIRSGLLAVIKWSVCMLRSYWNLLEFSVSFSRPYAVLCIYHLFVWSYFNFLHNSQWITLPTQSCRVLHSFCANFLHLLITWLIISYLSPQNVYLLFCCVLSILDVIWIVLMWLFCPAIRKDSVSLWTFLFLSHNQFFCVWGVAY